MRPSLEIFQQASRAKPHASYESFLVAGHLDAGAIFVLCAICMYCRMKAKPPGVAYTYCWLWCCILSLFATNDGKSLAACIGVGINFSWYMCQFIHSTLWRCVLPYWEDYLPKWCVSFAVRIGDFGLHLWPCSLFVPYLRFVGFRVAAYAFLLERWYFFLIERQLIGTGRTCNIIYDLRPRQGPQIFITCQCLSTLVFITIPIINVTTGKCFLRWFGVFVVVCSLVSFIFMRTDRLELFGPECSQRKLGQCKSTDAKSIGLLEKASMSMGSTAESQDSAYTSQLWDLWYAQWSTGCRNAAELSSALDELVLQMQTSAERLIETAMQGRLPAASSRWRANGSVRRKCTTTTSRSSGSGGLQLVDLSTQWVGKESEVKSRVIIHTEQNSSKCHDAWGDDASGAKLIRSLNICGARATTSCQRGFLVGRRRILKGKVASCGTCRRRHKSAEIPSFGTSERCVLHTSQATTPEPQADNGWGVSTSQRSQQSLHNDKVHALSPVGHTKTPIQDTMMSARGNDLRLVENVDFGASDVHCQTAVMEEMKLHPAPSLARLIALAERESTYRRCRDKCECMK